MRPLSKPYRSSQAHSTPSCLTRPPSRNPSALPKAPSAATKSSIFVRSACLPPAEPSSPAPARTTSRLPTSPRSSPQRQPTQAAAFNSSKAAPPRLTIPRSSRFPRPATSNALSAASISSASRTLLAMRLRCLLPVLTVVIAAASLAQQPAIDPALAREIDSVLAIDNHAHPMLSPPADATDREFDALPVDSMAPQTDPIALRPDWPPLHDAWLALFDIDLKPPLTPETQKLLNAARAGVKAREGEHYSAYILEKSGIATMVANRVAMGTGVQPPRFLWVPYEDALLFPLNNASI